MKHTLRLFPVIVAGVLSFSLTADAAPHVREIDREFNASEFSRLEVRVDSGQITAVVGNASVIRIEVDLESHAKDAAKAEELFDMAEILFDESSDELSLEIKKLPRKRGFLFFRGKRDRIYANVTVMVPPTFDVQLLTGSGSIEATGLTGKIVLDTGSGSVKGIDLTGEVVADTGSGNVSLENTEGNVTADTGSGNIQISGMNGELIADTGSGSVTATGNIHQFRVDTGSGFIKIDSFAQLKARSVADTGSGAIRINLPASSAFEVDADVGSGNIDIDFPLQSIQQKKHSFKAIANGGGPLLRLNTGSGNIRVQPNQ